MNDSMLFWIVLSLAVILGLFLCGWLGVTLARLALDKPTKPIYAWPDYITASQRDLIDAMYEQPGVPGFPKWMVSILNEECLERGINLPDKLTCKYVPHPAVTIWGYTQFAFEKGVNFEGLGEIAICYGPGKHFGTALERNTFLHELSHWLLQKWDSRWGGHDSSFYEELTRLTLKWGGDLQLMIDEEYRYMGNTVNDGLLQFHINYNGNHEYRTWITTNG